MIGLRINAGSGQRPFPWPWLNVDLQERWHEAAVEKGGEFVCCDMARMPFPDGSAGVVVSQHTLEHFQCDGGEPFVREVSRVLRPGGSLIVTVPDMKMLARAWLDGLDCLRNQENPDGKISDYIFFVNTYGAWMGNEADIHRWNYSFEGLCAMIEKNGNWSWVGRHNWIGIQGADIAQAWWIMGVKATRM